VSLLTDFGDEIGVEVLKETEEVRRVAKGKRGRKRKRRTSRATSAPKDLTRLSSLESQMAMTFFPTL